MHQNLTSPRTGPNLLLQSCFPLLSCLDPHLRQMCSRLLMCFCPCLLPPHAWPPTPSESGQLSQLSPVSFSKAASWGAGHPPLRQRRSLETFKDLGAFLTLHCRLPEDSITFMDYVERVLHYQNHLGVTLSLSNYFNITLKQVMPNWQSYLDKIVHRLFFFFNLF